MVAALGLLVQFSPSLCLLRAKQHFPAEVFGCDAVHVRAVPPFELASASSVALYFASAHRKQGSRANRAAEQTNTSKKCEPEQQRTERMRMAAHCAAMAKVKYELYRRASGNP